MVLLCILLFQSVFSYEVTTNARENSDVFETSNITNQIKVETNVTATMERITQPSQTQQIERTLAPSSANSSLKVSSKKEGDFRPSPQLETYFEYNKFPVKPVIGEAKTIGGFGEEKYLYNSWTERPLVPPWTDKQSSPWQEEQKRPNWNGYPAKTESTPWDDKSTTQQGWVSRVTFPTTSLGSSNENPYKYVTNVEHPPNYLSSNFPVTTEGFAFNKPVPVPSRNTKPSFWDKLLGPSPIQKKTPQPIQKTFYDYNLLEKPPVYGVSKQPEHELSGGYNPWQKIIKILTTIIPIGLLISALTPTVITVTAMNDTQSRYRAEDLLQQNIQRRFSPTAENLNKCKDRVLCELLVSASNSKDSERHIDNLLNTFAENEDLKNKKDDLLKVFDAVKKEDCSSIYCKTTKYPT